MNTGHAMQPDQPSGPDRPAIAGVHPAPSASEARVRSENDAVRLADLPESLGTLVRETVRRTRLRRRERAAVAAELAAHLRDGLDAGQSPAALVATFGKPEVAAPLIRRAAIAKRHPLDRVLHRTLRWGSLAVVLLMCVYVAAALRLWWLSPTIRFDPIERFNSMLPSAEGRPAWPLYKEGLRWHKEMWGQRVAAAKAAIAAGAPPEEAARTEREPGAALLGASDARRGQSPGPGSPEVTSADREADAMLLRSHQKEIATLREAAGRPVLGYLASLDVDPDDAAFFDAGLPAGTKSASVAPAAPSEFPALSILLPQLGEMRRAGRLLAADAWLAIADGDGARATDDFIAIFGTAAHAEENRTIVGQLVGSAIRAMASQHIRQAIAEAPDMFEESDLARLAAALASVPTSAYTLDTATERLGFEDSVQRLYSDDGEGDGVLLPQTFEKLEKLVATTGPTGPRGEADLDAALSFMAGPAAALVDPGRRAALAGHARLMDAVEHESRLDLWDPRSGSVVHQLEQELFAGGASGGLGLLSLDRTSVVLRILGPAVSRAAFERRLSRAWIDAAAVAVALERYRKARSAYPASLDALVPEFLDAVPRDPFDGQPLRYAVQDGAPMVWSIGNDRVDEGGQPAGGKYGVPDPDAAARWSGANQAPGFVDPRTGRWIARDRPRTGDWVMWAPTR